MVSKQHRGMLIILQYELYMPKHKTTPLHNLQLSGKYLYRTH